MQHELEMEEAGLEPHPEEDEDLEVEDNQGKFWSFQISMPARSLAWHQVKQDELAPVLLMYYVHLACDGSGYSKLNIQNNPTLI